VNTFQQDLAEHLEDSKLQLGGLTTQVQVLRSDYLTEISECRRSGDGLDRRLTELEGISGRLDLVSVGLRSVKTGLNRHVSGLWRYVAGLNTTVTTQGHGLDRLENVELAAVRSDVGALNTSLLHLAEEFHHFSTQDFTGESRLEGGREGGVGGGVVGGRENDGRERETWSRTEEEEEERQTLGTL